jgi:hypothetical protein
MKPVAGVEALAALHFAEFSRDLGFTKKISLCSRVYAMKATGLKFG